MTSGEALKDAMRNCVSYIKNATATITLEPALNAIIESTDLAAKYDDAKTELIEDLTDLVEDMSRYISWRKISRFQHKYDLIMNKYFNAVK